MKSPYYSAGLLCEIFYVYLAGVFQWKLYKFHIRLCSQNYPENELWYKELL